MPKEKAIDLRLPSFDNGGKKPGQPLLSAASLLVLLAAVFLIAIYFPQQKGSGEGAGAIEVFIDSAPLVENSPISIRAFSSCGDFSLYLDGKELGAGPARISASVYADAGMHLLVAKNGKCAASKEFSVAKKECEGNQTRPCQEGICTGTQTCIGGAFAQCILPPRVCVPGQAVGCSVDSCLFGYRTCNPCGTAFGPCLPRGETGANETSCANSSACQ